MQKWFISFVIIFSSLALQYVSKPPNEAGSHLHWTANDIDIHGWCQPENKWSGGSLRAAGKWFICVHFHYGSGKRDERAVAKQIKMWKQYNIITYYSKLHCRVQIRTKTNVIMTRYCTFLIACKKHTQDLRKDYCRIISSLFREK